MDNATITNILITAFGGLIALILASLTWFIMQYLKSNDIKHNQHFKEQAALRKLTNNLMTQLSWLVGTLDGKGCVDSGSRPCIQDEDDSQPPPLPPAMGHRHHSRVA